MLLFPNMRVTRKIFAGAAANLARTSRGMSHDLYIFLDLLLVRYKIVIRICITDFRKGTFLSPIREQTRKGLSWLGLKFSTWSSRIIFYSSCIFECLYLSNRVLGWYACSSEIETYHFSNLKADFKSRLFPLKKYLFRNNIGKQQSVPRNIINDALDLLYDDQHDL